MRIIARTAALGCAIWGLLAPGGAQAQDDDEDIFAGEGIYVLFQGNYFPENFDRPMYVSPTLVVDEADGGWGASGHFGYRIRPRWAAELEIDWVKNFDFDTGDPKSTSKSASINNGVDLSVNGKFYFLTGQFQPYAVFGVGMTSYQLDDADGNALRSRDTGFMYRGGLGIDMYGSEDETMGVNLEFSYVAPTGDASPYDHMSVGWGFIFRF